MSKTTVNQTPGRALPSLGGSLQTAIEFVTGAAERLGNGLEALVNSQRRNSPPVAGLGDISAGVFGLLVAGLAIYKLTRR